MTYFRDRDKVLAFAKAVAKHLPDWDVQEISAPKHGNTTVSLVNGMLRLDLTDFADRKGRISVVPVFPEDSYGGVARALPARTYPTFAPTINPKRAARTFMEKVLPAYEHDFRFYVWKLDEAGIMRDRAHTARNIVREEFPAANTWGDDPFHLKATAPNQTFDAEIRIMDGGMTKLQIETKDPSFIRALARLLNEYGV